MKYYVISRDGCSFCDKAKDLLSQKCLEFEELNLNELLFLRTLLLKARITKVPQIFTEDGTHIGGYSELEKSLD